MNTSRRLALVALVLCLGAPYAGSAGASAMRTMDDPTSADLQVSVRETSDPSIVGALLTYAVTVRNLGPDETPLANLETTFEGGYDNDQVSFDSPRGNCLTVGSTPPRHVCTFSPLAAGDSVVTTFGFKPSHAGTFTIHASVASGAPDGNPSNDSVTETTTITPPPILDVQVTVKESSDPSSAGEPLTYTVTVRNLGNVGTPFGALRTTYEGGYPLVSFNSSGGNCTSLTSRVECSFGELAPGDSFVTTLGFLPDQAGTLTINAIVGASGTDIDLSNNSATETTTITPSLTQADLFVTADRRAMTIGEPATIEVFIGNRGLAPAVGAWLDTQLGGIRYRLDSYENPNGTCATSGSGNRCELGTILPHTQPRVIIHLTPLEAGVLSTLFHVSSTSPEQALSDNTFAVDLAVAPTFDSLMDTLLVHVHSLALKAGPAKALLRPLADASAAAAANDNPGTCAAMLDFEAAVRKWGGRAFSLDATDALLAEAEGIRQFLYCPDPAVAGGQSQSGTSTPGTDTSAPHSPTLQLGPNPTGSSTRLSFDLGRNGHAKLSVFDVRGRLVQVLADGTFTSGPHEVTWDHPAAPGVYFYRFEPEGGAPITMRGVILP